MGFPNGHFYSPVIDPADLRQREGQLWGNTHNRCSGLDFNPKGQAAVIDSFRPFAAGYDYPPGNPETSHQKFTEPNGLFESLDSRALYCMLQARKPARMIEVGSGFSSLLTADVNVRHCSGMMDFRCIEPYPPDFLDPLPNGITSLTRATAQQVGLEPFRQLQAGDFLFIDSSHVSKTGSDVNFLYLEVIPELPPGVIIHIHDIFLPSEYPKQWVLEEERSWNEQYLLQALLIFTSAFRVLFGSYYASQFLPDQIQDTFGGLFGGGSFWLEKIA